MKNKNKGDMRDKILLKYHLIKEKVSIYGSSYGSEIATQDEVDWLVEQAARDGIMLSFKAAPDTWQQGDECYYHYSAMTIKERKERVRQFVDIYPLPSVSALKKMMPADTTDPDELRVAENIKAICRLKKAADSRRRRLQHNEEIEELQNQILECIEIDRQEAADHRDDLKWLVARIESMGWEVTLRRKKKKSE